MQAGTYHEKVTISGKNNITTATESDRIVIEADPLAPPGSVIVAGASSVCTNGYAFQLQQSKFITIRGLTISGTGGQAISLLGGINQSQAIHIEQNRIFGNGSSECNGGITIARGNPDTLIVNNLIYANGRNGITFIDADGGPHYIVENTIHANQWSGVNVARSHEVFLVNNAITQNGTATGTTGGRFGVSREASTAPQPQGITLLNNLICGNRLGEINGPALDATDSGNLTPQGTQGPGVSASPGCEIPTNVYANVNGPDALPNSADDDFRLVAHSPAIDRGMDPRTLGLNVLFNSIFEADFSTDAARPSDGNADRIVLFDMGAFEFPNAPPVANAGPDQSVFTGTLVTLNGSQSQDPEGATLTFQWTIVSQPAGSSASLSNPTSVAPQFTPLVAGTYTIQLVVNDGQLDSAPDAVTVTARVNNPPTANANGPYSGTVGVPIQFNGTGTDPDGDPISFSWNFGDGSTPLTTSGGTVSNPTHAYAIAGTFTVTLTVTDSFGAVGTSQTTATVNQGLVLNPIGDKTVNLGETLIFTVSATSTSGTPNLFVSPLPLPNHATFNAVTGLFTFSPDTTQVGSFQLTFSAVSDNQTVSETITITVPQPPPGGVTTLRGKVENLNDTPLGNVKVTLRATGRTAFSGVDGIFFLDGIPSGRQELIVNGREANLGVFAILAVPVDLIEGVLNNLASPITLPDVDVDAEVAVSQTDTTVVANPNVPGVALTIPPATATNSDGTPYTGKLSINPVPDYGRPESRPEELRPGMAITIQPAGVRFNPPAKLTFPNADGMVPGSELNLWSLSPDTGTFSIVGKGMVTQDGQSIVTTEGGVRASAWHFFLPPGGSSNTDVDESEGLVQDPAKQCLSPVSSTVALQNGCLGVEFALPSYRSLGTSRSLRFIYKSNRANPQPVIPFNATIPVRAAVPPRLSYSLSVGGVEQGNETFINTSGLDESRDETVRAVASFDASQLKTGVYPYRIKLTSNYLNSAISSFISDKVLVVNEQKSPFGGGWGIEGLGKLNFNADGSALLTDGSGSALTFRREVLGQVAWWPGEGDANDIAGANHGTLQNGVTFAAGKVGKAFSFDGVDDFVDFGNVLNFERTDPFTFVFWIRQEPTVSSANFIIAKQDNFNPQGSNNGQGYRILTLSDGRIDFAFINNQIGGVSNWLGVLGSRNIRDGLFHHVAVTYDGSSRAAGTKIYVDGVSDTLTINSDTLSATTVTTEPFRFGAREGATFALFKGSLDEVQIYNRALSASEIQAIFTSPGQPLLAGNFTTPAGDFSTLVKNNDETFTRALKDGTKINFNAQGLQTSVMDRNDNTTSYGYDGSGRLISITDPAGLITSFTYTGSLLSSITDPGGRTSVFTSDAQGNLTRVAFPAGSFKSFGYDSKHLMTTETDERGSLVRREYDGVGRLVRATLPDGTVRSATNAQTVGFADPSTGLGTITNPAPVVRPASALSTFTDGAGNTQIVKIGKFGAPQRITDALGQTIQIERGAGNNGALQGGATFASGQISQAFSFDGVNDFVLVPDSSSLDLTTQFTLAAWINPSSLQSDPARGGIISKVGGTGGNNGYQFGLTGNNTVLFCQFNAPGEPWPPVNVVVVTLPSAVTVGQWSHTVCTYNNSDLKIYLNGTLVGTKFVGQKSVINSASNLRISGDDNNNVFFHGLMDEVQIFNRALSATEIQTLFTAGNIGNRATPPVGLVAWWQGEGNAIDSAGGAGLPTKITRPNGAVVTMSYDSKGNLLSSTDPVGATTIFTYEANFNQVTSIRDPKNSTTSITYDLKGNPTQIRDSQGNVTQMSYDLRGLLTSVTDSQAKTTTFAYDLKGNLITTTDPLGQLTTLQYNQAGNVVKSSDSEGRVTEFTYDLFNRLISVIDHNNDVTRYAYDAKGNLTEVMDTKAQRTSFTYDVQDRLASSTNPQGLTEAFSYDANGNLTSTSNRNLQPITFNYDALNRLIQKGRPPTPTEVGSQVTTFAYDSVGNLISVVDPDSAVSMAYDLANRLTSTTASTPSVPAKTVSYAYDLNGNRTTMTDPQSGATNYVYDSLNRLTSVTNPSAKTTSFAYDNLGRRTSMTHGNGVVTSYSYDAASQLLSLAHQLGATTVNSFTYTYDRVGNRKTKVDRNGTSGYTYDTLNRLVQTTNPLPVSPETYVYDAVGNRVDSNQNGLSTFNAANQLLEDSAFTYQYDNNGNLTRKTAKVGGAITSYEYDAENKLVRVVSNGTVVNQKYDGLGRRVEKEVLQGPVANVTRYIYDNEDILLELDGSNNITARYTHGPGIDEPLVMEKSGASFFYHADGLGSITEITNLSGTVVQAYSYSSFGKIESQLDPSFVQPYTFTAREFDPETELYHYRERQYDWKTGRFNQVDPFGGILILPQSLHGYRYAANNPVKLADPFGLYDVTFSFGFHVPVSPGLAVGPVVSSTIVGYSNNPSAPITPNPTDVEIAVGVIADIGVAVGISDLSGTGGACAGPSINFGLGTRAGIQIVPRLVQDRSKSIFNPLRYIDGISLGTGAGVALPVNVSQPLNVGQPQPAR